MCQPRGRSLGSRRPADLTATAPVKTFGRACVVGVGDHGSLKGCAGYVLARRIHDWRQ